MPQREDVNMIANLPPSLLHSSLLLFSRSRFLVLWHRLGKREFAQTGEDAMSRRPSVLPLPRRKARVLSVGACAGTGKL